MSQSLFVRRTALDGFLMSVTVMLADGTEYFFCTDLGCKGIEGDEQGEDLFMAVF